MREAAAMALDEGPIPVTLLSGFLGRESRRVALTTV